MLRRCLESIEALDARATLQAIVVDNGSSDGSAGIGDDFPNVQFIRLPKNFGLTKALNLGWRAADAEYVFFLHDDTEVQPSTVRLLADALDTHADAAAVCPLLVDDRGQPAPQLGSLPPTGVWRPATPGAPVAVEFPRGAALMLISAACVRHEGRSSYSAVERADFLSSRAVFLGKYQGFGAGIQARIAAVLGPLAGFRLGELKYTINGQKIDGTQE